MDLDKYLADMGITLWNFRREHGPKVAMGVTVDEHGDLSQADKYLLR